MLPAYLLVDAATHFGTSARRDVCRSLIAVFLHGYATIRGDHAFPDEAGVALYYVLRLSCPLLGFLVFWLAARSRRRGVLLPITAAALSWSQWSDLPLWPLRNGGAAFVQALHSALVTLAMLWLSGLPSVTLRSRAAAGGPGRQTGWST